MILPRHVDALLGCVDIVDRWYRLDCRYYQLWKEGTQTWGMLDLVCSLVI